MPAAPERSGRAGRPGLGHRGRTSLRRLRLRRAADVRERTIGLGAAMAGTTATRIPTTGNSGMLGKARGEKETVRPGTSSARAIVMATSATSPEPATIHSGRRQGSGR